MPEENLQPKGTILLMIILCLLLFAFSIVYFGGRNGDSGSITTSPTVTSTLGRQPRVYSVLYGLWIFSPTNIRIHVGDSVKFQNDSRGSLLIVSDSTKDIADWIDFNNSRELSPGEYFTYTFNSQGIFGYYNKNKPLEEGTVIVRP